MNRPRPIEDVDADQQAWGKVVRRIDDDAFAGKYLREAAQEASGRPPAPKETLKTSTGALCILAIFLNGSMCSIVARGDANLWLWGAWGTSLIGACAAVIALGRALK